MDSEISGVIQLVKTGEKDGAGVHIPFERFARYLLLDETSLPSDLRLSLIECIAEIAFNPSIITLKGFELLYPGLWNLIYLSSSIDKGISSLVFPVLNQIIRFNSFVDFNGSLPSVLLISIEKTCESYLLETDCLLFLNELLQYGVKHNIDLGDCLMKGLIVCCDNFDSSCKNDSLWNCLLLMIKLINLMPSIDDANSLLDYLHHPILFCLDCLKTRRFSGINKHFCIVLQFLASLSNVFHSFKWLEKFCNATNQGEPLTLVVTTITIELRLYLTQKSSQNTNNNSIKNKVQCISNSNNETEPTVGTSSENYMDMLICSDPSIINYSISEACLLLFRYCLEELQKNNNDDLDITDKSNNNFCNYSLISYATDETVKNIWLQCLDTSELLQNVLVSLHLSTRNQNSNCELSTHPQFLWDNLSNEVKPLGAVLLETYFIWIEVYFKTHCMEYDKDCEIMSVFKELFNKYLTPVLPILNALMTHFFENYLLPVNLHRISSTNNSKFIQCVVNISTTLVQLSRIPSNPELLTDLFVYDSTDKPLRGDMVCKWLKQMCCIHVINSQGTNMCLLVALITNILELINNCLLNTLFFDTKDDLQKMNLITWFLNHGGLFQFFVGNWISSVDSFSANQSSLCIEYICIVIKIWIMYHKWSDLFTCNLDDQIKASLINIPDELLNRIDKILYLFEATSSNSSVEYHISKLYNACTEAAEFDIRFLDISVLIRDI
ncbi:hypothetical protein MN116_002380 [Schistosoma mekongi]|uniref:Uncharacterized protein n=1 Tax=Schistosoma mekongi TaxID=38744 RepID=A0AAE2D8C7_SCHME|nr:hypothetical protein MN116_002380 [Schistosoma mekongi]